MNIKDRFLRFTYNDINSEEFNIFYENNGEDISFPFSPVVNHSFSNPLYQQNSYWMGSDIQPRSATLTCIAQGKTMSDTEEIFKWLNPREPGTLRFDFRDNYQFEVAITKIGDPVMIPQEFQNGVIEMILKFSITFTTINNHTATSIDETMFNQTTEVDKYAYELDQFLPIAIKKASNRFHFYNWTNVKQDLIIAIGGTSPKVKKGFNSTTELVYGYDSTTAVNSLINTNLGTIQTGNKLIEVKYPNAIVANKGPNSIKPGLVYEGKLNLVKSGTQYKITANNRMKNLESTTFVMAIMPKIDKNTKTAYFSRREVNPLTSERNEFTGLYPVDEVGNIIKPQILIGSISGGILTFAAGATNFSGEYDVKIARVEYLDIEQSAYYSIQMKYKKEV